MDLSAWIIGNNRAHCKKCFAATDWSCLNTNDHDGALIVKEDDVNFALRIDADMDNLLSRLRIETVNVDTLVKCLHEESALPGMIVIADYMRKFDSEDFKQLDVVWKLYTLLIRAVNVIQNVAGKDEETRATKQWLVSELARKGIFNRVMINVKESTPQTLVLAVPSGHVDYGALSFSYGSSYCNVNVQLDGSSTLKLLPTSLLEAVQATRKLSLTWLWTDYLNDLSIRSMQLRILLGLNYKYEEILAKLPEFVAKAMDREKILEMNLPENCLETKTMSFEDDQRAAFAFVLRSSYLNSKVLISGGFNFIQMNYFGRGWIVQEYLAYKQKLRSRDVSGGGFINQIRDESNDNRFGGIVLAVAALQCTSTMGFASMDDMRVAMLSMEMFDMTVDNEKGRKFEKLVKAAHEQSKLDRFENFVEQAKELASHVVSPGAPVEKGEIIACIKSMMRSCAPDYAMGLLSSAKSTTLYRELYQPLLKEQIKILKVDSMAKRQRILANRTSIFCLFERREWLFLIPIISSIVCVYALYLNGLCSRRWIPFRTFISLFGTLSSFFEQS